VLFRSALDPAGEGSGSTGGRGRSSLSESERRFGSLMEIAGCTELISSEIVRRVHDGTHSSDMPRRSAETRAIISPDPRNDQRVSQLRRSGCLFLVNFTGSTSHMDVSRERGRHFRRERKTDDTRATRFHAGEHPWPAGHRPYRISGIVDVDLEVSMDGLEGIADMLGVRASSAQPSDS
jgi:hypothetical protein